MLGRRPLIRNPLDLQDRIPGGNTFEDRLFLLDERGTILAARSEPEHSVRGKSFFDIHPAKVSEKNELRRFLTGFGDIPVFFRCIGKTVLFLTPFYAETGLTAALVPCRSLAVFTDSPAALAESFPGVYFTEGVSNRRLPPSEQQYAMIHRYLLRCGRVEVSPPEIDITRAFYSALAAQIETVASLTGCTIDYNLSGLDIRSSKNPAIGRFMGILMLMALTAVRTARDCALKLTAEPIDPEAPLFVAEMNLADPEDPLPELNNLGGMADSFGFYADYRREGEHYEMRWSVGHRELSRQGLKHPSVYPVAKTPYPMYPYPKEDD